VARFSRPNRASRDVVPEPPYYAEGELVRERVVTETVVDPAPAVVRDDTSWLWVLLIPLALLIALGAYLLGSDDDGGTVINQSPTTQPTVVVTQPPAAPPAAPPVIITQPPAATQAPPPQQTAPASPAPATS
jgi:hypothetical protein